MMTEEEKEHKEFTQHMKAVLPKRLYEIQQSPLIKTAESELLRLAAPDSIDWRLRLRFNSLLAKIRELPIENQVIRVPDLFEGVCSYEVYKRRIAEDAKAVFITRKIGSYLEDQDALLSAMSTRLWEIASMPISENGKLNIEACKVIHATIKILLDRKFGQAVQRVVAVNSPLPIDHSTYDPVALEAEVRQIEAIANAGKKR